MGCEFGSVYNRNTFKIAFVEEQPFRLHCYYYQVPLFDLFSFSDTKSVSGSLIEHCFETQQVSTCCGHVLLMLGSLRSTINTNVAD